MSVIEFPREHAMLLDIATRTLRQRWPVDRVREHLEAGPGFDAELQREIHELGWTSLAVPTELGGAGESLAALVPLVEPMGRQLLGGPFVPTQVALRGLLAAPPSAARDGWIERVVEGRHLGLALLEEDGSWELFAPETRLVEAQGSFEVHGTKVFVEHHDAVDGLLLSARADDGDLALVLLESSLFGQSAVRAERVVDLTRRSATLRFDAVSLREVAADAACVWRGEDAQVMLRAVREAAWLLSAAEACGGLAGVLAVLIDYLRQRKQFGRTIGSYQALKHPTVDLLIGLERSRSLLYHAATLIGHAEAPSLPNESSEAEAREREIALRMAKAAVGDVFVQAGDRAIQFHGAVGFTWECDAQLYLRRALWLETQWGDALHHRRKLAELVC